MRYSSAYSPPCASSSVCRPRSTMRPRSTDEDLVGAAHRREPIGDDQGGSPVQGGVEGALDGNLRLAVQVRGGLVQHDDLGRLEQQPSDGQALLLPAGEPVAPVADHGVESSRRRVHPVKHLRGGQHLRASRPQSHLAWRRRGWPGPCRGTGAPPGSPSRPPGGPRPGSPRAGPPRQPRYASCPRGISSGGSGGAWGITRPRSPGAVRSGPRRRRPGSPPRSDRRSVGRSR